MPLVMIVSSYVAASRVGGGIAPFVLAPMKIDPVVIPTCLYGRHPGWGPPGGAPVAASTMAQMLEGVEANHLFGLTDAIVTGHFSAPEQIAVACEAIDRVRAAPRLPSHELFPAKPFILVDPVMGDDATGPYVGQATASALIEHLVPRADLIAPNLWEFRRLTGLGDTPLAAIDVARHARTAGGAWLVSSVREGDRIGAVYANEQQAWFASDAFVEGATPNGTGDLLTLMFLGRRICGVAPGLALSQAVGATRAVIERAIAWHSTELPLAACGDLFTDPPGSVLQRLDP